jgi:type II secretory pathway component PulJ
MIFRPKREMRRRGLLLVDLMMYLSLLALVLILTAVVFDQALKQSSQLQRNVSDIERAMKAGERWRGDVRSATAPPRLAQSEGAEFFVIPNGTNEVAYSLQKNKLLRFDSSTGRAEIALEMVKSNRVIFEKRAEAEGWRWELELDQRRKNARVRPLFTFMAVPEKR